MIVLLFQNGKISLNDKTDIMFSFNKQNKHFSGRCKRLDFHIKQTAENIKKISNLGKLIFVITHDPEFIKECCNYLVLLDNGKIDYAGIIDDKGNKILNDFFNM